MMEILRDKAQDIFNLHFRNYEGTKEFETLREGVREIALDIQGTKNKLSTAKAIVEEMVNK